MSALRQITTHLLIVMDALSLPIDDLTSLRDLLIFVMVISGICRSLDRQH
tara:strand:- start:260 stop:409 length:150 start_codon:yes stop_codon:yes gene_type:complete